MSVFLVAAGGPHAGERFAVTAVGVWVGRVSGPNQIVIDDPAVSRRHSRIYLKPGGSAWVEDHSSNGTFIEGRRVEGEAELQPGERVRFGGAQAIAFELLGAMAAAAPRSAPPPRSRPFDAPPPTCWLEVVAREAAARRVEIIPPRLELSRAEPGASSSPGLLRIAHPTISVPHAEILLEPGQPTRLRDLDSTNGTFVNGARQRECELQDGDLIQLGSCDGQLLLFRDARPRTLELTDIDLSQAVMTIGRGEGNTVRLSHPTVSHFHCEIRNDGASVTIADLGSTNGTFVNGAPVQGAQPLEAGDRVGVGAVQFVFDGSHFEGRAEGGRAGLAAQGLSVEVKDRGSERGEHTKILLDDISMLVEPCQFVGLLGGSGAGKSTLMDALNGSRPATRGRVLVNHSDLYREFAAVRSLIGYVPQDDILHVQLTAQECLYYSARLRLPDDFTETALRERVEEVIQVLELSEQARQPIRSLSGGQRKRVSVGIELLSDPSLLFLDEPTAGQDPKNELQMMQLFRRIANQGAAVIINTHLLGSFGLLDRVAVLVGGKMAYYGPAPEMLGYFGCSQPHEVYYRLKEGLTPEQWGRQYRQSPLFPRYAGDSSAGRTKPVSAAAPEASAPAAAAKPKHSAWRQLGTVWSRQLALKLKDKGNLAMLVFPPSIIAALIGIMNLASHGTAVSYPNSPMSLFMMVLVGLWFGCSATVREIVDEAAVYRRERQRELKRSSYIGSKLLYLAVIALAQSALFMAVMGGMQVMIHHLLAAWLLMWLITVQGGLIGLLISALARSAEQALYAFPLVMIVELLFAGMLIPTAALRPFFPVVATAQGQIARLEVVPPPDWFRAPAPMSPLLRDSVSAVAVSRWSLEALADLYSADAARLADCYESQMGEAHTYDCGYSVVLLNSVALTLRPQAPAQAEAYLRRVGAALAAKSLPPPAGPAVDALASYLAVEAGFALVMIGLIALAMRREESHHAG